MRQFFNQPHPWIMQAIGGLIAVIAIIPVAVIVVLNVLNSKAPEQAVQPLAPPVSTQPVQGVQNAQTPQSGLSGGGQGGKIYTVKMQPSPNGTYVFSPANLTIHTGDTIHWVDVNAVPHNIVGTGSAASLINRTAVNTDPYSVTFTKAGTYHYECQVHLPSMVGTITVVGAQATTGSTNAGTGGVAQGGAVPATWAVVHTIFAKNCTPCHIGASTGGLNLDTYANAMKGGSTAAGGPVNGAVIKPGDAAGSYLYQAITGKQKAGSPMPFGRPPLAAADIQAIYNWIQGGAKS